MCKSNIRSRRDRLRTKQNPPPAGLRWFYCFLAHWVTWQPGIVSAKIQRRLIQDQLSGVCTGAQGQVPTFLPSCPQLPSVPSPAPAPSSLPFQASYRQQAPATQLHGASLSHLSCCPTVIDKSKHSIVTCHRNKNCSGEEIGNVLYSRVTKDLKVILPTGDLIYTGQKQQQNKNVSNGLCNKGKCCRGKPSRGRRKGRGGNAQPPCGRNRGPRGWTVHDAGEGMGRCLPFAHLPGMPTVAETTLLHTKEHSSPCLYPPHQNVQTQTQPETTISDIKGE